MHTLLRFGMYDIYTHFFNHADDFVYEGKNALLLTRILLAYPTT